MLVADEPVPPELLAQLLELPTATRRASCAPSSPRRTTTQGHGFLLVGSPAATASRPIPTSRPYVERFVLDGQSARLSAAALETLAIIAYKQPISRAQIAVDPRRRTSTACCARCSSAATSTEVGRDPGPGPGGAVRHDAVFLERLGLDSLADLPPLAEFVPERRRGRGARARRCGLRAADAPATAA